MDGEISITVQDEGMGFNPDVIADPTDGNKRLLCHGRGVNLMQALMDEVSFENDGNVVHMKKKLGSRLSLYQDLSRTCETQARSYRSNPVRQE